MREAVAPSAELVTTEGISTDSEEEGFGKEGVQLYTGFSAFGPELGVGFTAGTLSIEAHGVYHLINWDKAQDIWNKTVPGGFLASLQVFPMAAGSFLPWRLKPFLGGEFGRVNEGNGKTYKAISGEPTKGYWQWADAQIGIRAYVTSRISITAWGGYVLWKTDKHSMLAQYAKVGYRDNFSRVLGNVTIGYTW